MAESVADFIVRRLREWGVRRIYGYPGDGINGITGALQRASDEPRFIQVRHEEMAAMDGLGPRQVHGRGRRLPRHLGSRVRSIS
jgi:pyruvate dehydrogenase (quinone)